MIGIVCFDLREDFIIILLCRTWTCTMILNDSATKCTYMSLVLRMEVESGKEPLSHLSTSIPLSHVTLTKQQAKTGNGLEHCGSLSC